MTEVRGFARLDARLSDSSRSDDLPQEINQLDPEVRAFAGRE
jgi:hypothetical protein